MQYYKNFGAYEFPVNEENKCINCGKEGIIYFYDFSLLPYISGEIPHIRKSMYGCKDYPNCLKKSDDNKNE